MSGTSTVTIKTSLFVCLLAISTSLIAQDGTIYSLEAPAEPNAIQLGTGGVDNQPSRETWFRQWGDPMARNISTATLTPFLPKPGEANGAAVIVAPGGGSFQRVDGTVLREKRCGDCKQTDKQGCLSCVSRCTRHGEDF